MVGMMAIDSVDTDLLAKEASDLAAHPGALSESSVQGFLAKYPFPVLFGVLSSAGTQELVTRIVEAIDKILLSPYGRNLLITVLPYANAGLSADSPLVRRLACSSLATFLENGDPTCVHVADSFDIIDSLVAAICDIDSSVAKAASDAVVNLAKSHLGLDLLFDANGNRLKELAVDGSDLVQIRALSATARIYGLSDESAAAVQNSGILSVLESQLENSKDILSQLNAFEILAELAQTPSGTKLLLAGNFVSQLTFWLRNNNVDSMVRSRSMQVASRMIRAVPEADALQIIDAIGNCLRGLEHLEVNSERFDKSERDAAFDALGQIGSFSYGAQVLLLGVRPPAYYVVHAAFRPDLAAIHALASISGSEREDVVLNAGAENALRDLVFDAVHSSSKQTLSNFLFQLLRQTPELRHAIYRLIVPLASRPWCLLEVSSNEALIDFLVDPRTESSKEGMEWRHACCVALSSALRRASERSEPILADALEKLNEATRRGPYVSRDHVQAIPVVATEERF